ncbi:S1 RNA-binding domain-containing protein 1 isoform X2 [Rhynchophorus ferrugineus]
MTSDSDDEIVFKKVKKEKKSEQKMLGEISLISDEELPEDNVKPRVTRRPRRVQNAIKVIDVMTSDDEDEDYVEKPSKEVKPRKTRLQSTKTKVAGGELDIRPKKRKISNPQKQVTVKNDESDESIPDIKPKKRKLQSTTVAPKKTRISKKVVKKETKKDVSLNASDPGPIIDCNDASVTPSWTDFELLAERTCVEKYIAKNIFDLLNDGNTIPFIARYRKNFVGNMSPEELRTAKEHFDDICALKKKISTVITTVGKMGKLNEKLQQNICAVKTSEELDHIYTPFKSVGSKKSLVEKAKQLGLEVPALQVLNNTALVNVFNYINPEVKDLKTPDEVEKNIVHIIASEIATDSELLTFLRDLRCKTKFVLETKRARQTKASDVDPNKKNSQINEMKFEQYFEFSQQVLFLKSHQILAINRGEALKILNVKINIPDFFEHKYKQFCFNKWLRNSSFDSFRKRMMDMAIDDAYRRLIVNFITRELRQELRQKAEKESCKIFSENLKNLLLSRPLKGKPILAIDPGYSNGCKLALISETGSLLMHNVIYPHSRRSENRGEGIIKTMLMKHNCELIGIGNGTACRETEEWIVTLIKTNYFKPLNVNYIIVNEDGASIYSCSPEARKEFGDLDPNIISAVSLARRMQDPMAELVKVEPSHLGVGMYQLDIKKKQLEEALGQVVSECVSFVGVDLNTASQCLLRRVAGLTDSKATQIILYREKEGYFQHRRQLLEVYGIGERIFEQCAGFLRVGPLNPHDKSFYKNKQTTPLDATIIHPESYHIVRSLLVKMGLKEQDVGSDSFIATFKSKRPALDVNALSATFKSDKENISLILDALSKKLNHDLRSESNNGPLFRRDITSFEELASGTVLTGRVNNVTSFGAFVDIGVGTNGLLHNKFMKGVIVQLGDVIEVKVININAAKRHISLEALRKL